LVVVEPASEREFLAPLPARRLWGVGPKTEASLKRIGLERIGQIADMQWKELFVRMGDNGAHLWQLAQGIDDQPVTSVEGQKSIGLEHTFEKDTADFILLHATLLALTEKVSPWLRMEGFRARTVVVKFREFDFSIFTRRTILSESADTSE
jgi:DNA polymerase-4